MTPELEFHIPTDDVHERVTLFADVILPLPLPKLYTYRVPYQMSEEVMVGARVLVQFGSKKVLSCVVARVHETPPKDYQAKYLLEVIDEKPVVTEPQLKLFQWMAEYYMCTLGEVINAALPSALKLSSESQIQLHPQFNDETNEWPLTAHEENIIFALRQKQSLTFTEVGQLLQLTSFHKIIKSLLLKDVIIIYEEIAEKYAPKVVKKVRLTSAYTTSEETLEELFNQLASKPKQLDVLLKYVQLSPILQNLRTNEEGIEKNLLTSNPHLSLSAINTLLKHGIMEQFDVVVSRFPMAEGRGPYLSSDLSPAQAAARDAVLETFGEKDTVLLHGITGSGKTEIYMDLIQKAVEAGGQVLYLLPEIALTTQIVTRLKRVFGDRLGVYHSKFSDNERVEVWNGILSGRFQVVVGVRSSVFLPFHSLSLLIVDEEHEPSYKQHDPAPRYNAREVALMMAHFHQAKTLLGSATPSVETYYHCQSGKWGLVNLLERYGEATLPLVELVDVRQEGLRKNMLSHFSQKLVHAIEDTLHRHEQVILFQNRRGYAPFIDCNDCAWIPKCRNCAVSLSYHKFSNELRCHYCGYTERKPNDCPACGSTMLKTVGFGTEKIEDELKLILPQSRIQRMDLDTTKRKNSHQQIIEDFEMQRTDILVGTQMVTKGLDFEHVSLVGILSADSIIHFPDFRAHERAFQLFVQVSGRAGRKGKNGKVLIQTANPNQPIFQRVIDNDYQGLYQQEIAERQKFRYPPFVRMIRMTIKHPEARPCEQAAILLAKDLNDRLGRGGVLGPEAPHIFKIRNQFLQEIHVKLDRESGHLKHSKNQILEAVQALLQNKEFKQLRVVIDVDPS
ncbi:primosomal protein N' [Rufibacter radiotolerans]|uniref:Replication restart protein PriA n=1 Tax=Rufibacter radiotolerans TaxID=1379910 RepID=A0A0H4VQB0_9BACT|nr:primosomal protein N' [Rufibacter radiotolerans]AKQ46102.1 primosomal protein N' [Rufibacter radiotolerans]